MKNYTLAVEDSKAKTIRERLTLEKLKTGKSIREIVTEIMLNDQNFTHISKQKDCVHAN